MVKKGKGSLSSKSSQAQGHKSQSLPAQAAPRQDQGVKSQTAQKSPSGKPQAKDKALKPLPSKSKAKPESGGQSGPPRIKTGLGHQDDGAGKGAPVKAKNKETLLDYLRRFQQFLKEVVVEFRKISWPGKTQVVRETLSVLFLVTAITLTVLGFDWIVSHLFFNPLEYWARLHGGGIGRG